jgi:hypothetical protein
MQRKSSCPEGGEAAFEQREVTHGIGGVGRTLHTHIDSLCEEVPCPSVSLNATTRGAAKRHG